MFGSFTGRSFHTVDAKGRVAVPVKFRETLQQQYEPTLVVTTWAECLWCYPPAEWQKLLGKLDDLNSFDDEVQILFTVFVGGAEEIPLDSQGRVQLTQEHREYAGLDREAVVNGAHRRIEIWAKDRFAARRVVTSEQSKAIGRRLSEIGFKA